MCSLTCIVTVHDGNLLNETSLNLWARHFFREGRECLVSGHYSQVFIARQNVTLHQCHEEEIRSVNLTYTGMLKIWMAVSSFNPRWRELASIRSFGDYRNLREK